MITVVTLDEEGKPVEKFSTEASWRCGMKPGTSDAYIRVENQTMVIVVSEREAFDAVPGESMEHGIVVTKELRTEAGVVLIFQHWTEAGDVNQR